MILRKSLIPFMAALLAALPFLGIFTGEAFAATSRVAIIKEMTGTVQIKKSGGSKQFKAFTRMSLNEGDVLTTGANSTAALQFSNGTSEDDKMSVSANTTLTFSKLSDRKGTRTKVSMFNGTAWVDVKSIASKDDEFTLETPTAIMGVRGTHLLVSVDPVSGATKLTVAAGVVNTQPTDGSQPQAVMAGDNALITKDEEDNGEMTIASADLELLIKQSDKSIIEAIVAASGDIVKENQEKLDQYFDDAQTQQQPDDLTRKKTNVENLLGAIVDNAVKSGLITQERVSQLIAEAEQQAGVTIDLNKKAITLSDEQKNQLAEQKRKEEDARKQADEKSKAAEEERKKNDQLNRKLEQERRQKEDDNRQAEEDKKKKAAEEYQKQLDAAEQQRFKDEKDKRDEDERKAKEAAAAASAAASRSPSPSPSATASSGRPGEDGSTTTNLRLNNLSLQYYKNGISSLIDVDGFVFQPNTASSAEVSANTSELYLKPVVSSGISIQATIGGSTFLPFGSEGMIYIPLQSGINPITISVYRSSAPSVKVEYSLNVNRRTLPDLVNSWTSEALPAKVPIDWKYVGYNSFAYQNSNLVQDISVDFTYEKKAYALDSAFFQRYEAGSPVAVSNITYTDVDGNVSLDAVNVPSGYGQIILHFTRSPSAASTLPSSQSYTLWVLNEVSAPNWVKEKSIFKFSNDATALDILTETPMDVNGNRPTGAVLSTQNKIYISSPKSDISGYRINYFTWSGATVTQLTYGERQGWSIEKSGTSPEMKLTFQFSDRSGYYTYMYDVIITWPVLITQTRWWYEIPNGLNLGLAFAATVPETYRIRNRHLQS